MARRSSGDMNSQSILTARHSMTTAPTSMGMAAHS